MGDIETSPLANSNECTGNVSEDEFDELSVYEYMHPIVTELCNSLEDIYPSDVCESAKELVNKKIIRVNSKQVKILEFIGEHITRGRMVSCNYGNKERIHNSYRTKLF